MFARIWRPDHAQPKFILQICHGMCEYIDRYAEFAEYRGTRRRRMRNDHLGHGFAKQRNKASSYGYFADKNGEKLVMEDVHSLTVLIRRRYPVFLLY